MPAQADEGKLLIVSRSARMLAQSAHRHGTVCHTLDAFADADTRRLSRQWRQLESPQGFQGQGLLRLANELASVNEHWGLVYGSGLDACPDSIRRLAEGRELLGNPPEVLEKINHAEFFFQTLRRLGIPFPDTRFAPPADRRHWLAKAGLSEGGMGVAWADAMPLETKGYYQRWLAGAVHSLLFLANGKKVWEIGFNTLWASQHDPRRPFLFAGAVNCAALSEAQRGEVTRHASQITQAIGLRGLNSLDFVASDGSCRVLEINPRPSATMALYDEDFPEGLLALHIQACRGALPSGDKPSGWVRAMKIVYSPFSLCIPDAWGWPEVCADIPVAGQFIAEGQPLCSLLVQGRDRQATEALLQYWLDELIAQLQSIKV